MTLPSQFSLEEENFYKDIQDLVKKGSQNEKELSQFLERYMNLLARADLDDETFIINFTKAGLIIEASAKVYGTKVDRLWLNLEHVLESLKNNGYNQRNKKKSDCEEDGGEFLMSDIVNEGQEERKKIPNSSRRRKKLDSLFSPDDFIEIDNFTGITGRNINETKNNIVNKIKLCEKVPNMFIKNKTKKKKIDVCLNKSVDDKDFIRLRDWVISTNCLLVKEIYTPIPENAVFSSDLSGLADLDAVENQDPAIPFEDMQLVPTELTSEENLERNNNKENGLALETSVADPVDDDIQSVGGKENILTELNISKESNVEKLPNIMDRGTTDCLVDVDQVFWDSPKFQDVIPTKKMRKGKHNMNICTLCTKKKVHKRTNKKCIDDSEISLLDTYFEPHVQPILTVPHSGILPDKELYNMYKIETKLIDRLDKLGSSKNINEVYNPEETSEEIRNFLGFEGFENYLMARQTELGDDDDDDDNDILGENVLDDHLEDDNENCVEGVAPEFEVPLPVTEAMTTQMDFLQENNSDLNAGEFLEASNSKYQRLVMEELKDHYAAKSSFAKNKELGLRISRWHEMIADKIKLCEQRGALNMKILAERIMDAFPKYENSEHPVMSFKDLVKKQSRRDIPRYFFACLQLTNEGNLDILKSSTELLATNCVVIKRLRKTRTNYDLEENSSPFKDNNSPSQRLVGQTKRKRDSLSKSPVFESRDFNKRKKRKGKQFRSSKRHISITPVKNSKIRKYSTSNSESSSD